MEKLTKLLSAMLLLCAVNTGYGQVSTGFNSSGTSTHFVGWDNLVTFPLNIRHDAAQPINFFTNSSATPRATITSAGLFGINVTNPAYQLDVNGNAIHLTALNNVQSSGYMMNGKMILTQLIYGNLLWAARPDDTKMHVTKT